MPNPGATQSAAVRSAKSDQHALIIIKLIRQAEAEGATTLRDIAAWLNSRGHRTMRGSAWSSVQVLRVKRRAGILLS